MATSLSLYPHLRGLELHNLGRGLYRHHFLRQDHIDTASTADPRGINFTIKEEGFITS